MLKVFNVIGVIVLLLLLRKLIWCLRWLWCWKHDRETPPPIGTSPPINAARLQNRRKKPPVCWIPSGGTGTLCGRNGRRHGRV